MSFSLDSIIRVSLEYALSSGQQAFNVFHWATSGDTTCNQGDVDDAAVNVAALASSATSSGDALRDFLHSSITVVGCTARTVDPSNPLEDFQSIGLAGDAGASGVPVPAESSVVTTFYTGLPTRRGRGRTFMPGIPSGETLNGRLAASTQAAIQNFWLAVVADYAGSSVVPCVFSPTNGTAELIDDVVTRSVIHHQKSRNS